MSQPKLFSQPAFPTSGAAASRFLPGTRLTTPDGAKQVEMLRAGDDLRTRDGPRPIAEIPVEVIARADWLYRREVWPMRVPVGSLGNPEPMRLSQDQRVMLSGSAVDEIRGAPEVAGRVGDLVGLLGIIVERPMADLRRYGVSLGMAACVIAGGVPCLIGPEEEVPILDREGFRAVFRAMIARGEPQLHRE